MYVHFRDCILIKADTPVIVQERLLYVYDPKALHSIMVKDQHVYEKPSWLTTCVMSHP